MATIGLRSAAPTPKESEQCRDGSEYLDDQIGIRIGSLLRVNCDRSRRRNEISSRSGSGEPKTRATRLDVVGMNVGRHDAFDLSTKRHAHLCLILSDFSSLRKSWNSARLLF